MGQESSQVQQIEEDASSMDGNSSTRGGVEGDYPLPALPPSREARESSSGSSQLRRKMSNGISEDGAGDQGDSVRRTDKKLRKLLKKKSKDRNLGNSEGKDTEITSSAKQKKKKNRTSGGVARLSEASSQPAPLRSAAAVLLPRSDTVERVPESSHPTADAPSSSTAAKKKKKKKSKANRQSLQGAAAEDEGAAGDGSAGPKPADAEPESLAKDRFPPTPTSSWVAVNLPPSATKAVIANHDDINMTNGQNKHKDAEEETPEETESNSPKEQTDVNATAPKNSQARPAAADEMDLDPTQSQNTPANLVQDQMDLVIDEPENVEASRADDSENVVQKSPEGASKEVPQIGVYAAGEEPASTTRRRKRRLPVDDDPIETPFKKSKKTLKAKSPVAKGQKSKTVVKASGDSSAPQTPKRKAAAEVGQQLPRLNDADLAVIKNQLLKHREMNDITEEEQNRLIQGKADGHHDLFNLVCEEFPDRPRWSIIKFCRRKFHNFAARGKWSPEDDEDLKEAHRKTPNRWTQIGEVLNRHPEDCRDRWRNYLICGDNMITVYWNDDEEQKLRDVVAECVSHLQEMRQLGLIETNPGEDEQDDIELVDWQSVSEKMGRTRSRLQCRQKWKRMHDREDSGKIDSTPLKVGVAWREKIARKVTRNMNLDEKLMVLRSIKESQVGREGKIQWRKIGDENLRSRFDTKALKVAFMKLRDTVPDAKSHKLQDIVGILLEKLGNANGQDPTEESFREITPVKKTRNQNISKETVRSDDEESDGDAEDQTQELPKLKDTNRSPEKKKLSDRMARRSESVDSLGNAIPSGGPEVPESEYDEPTAPKTNGARKSAKSNSDSDSDSDSDLDEEIPARRTSISL
ncbi:hypothetical protein V491_01102 [Pseudogymnoascus sp. VKM F-3775]|nr:hypothetical protein V491_01102 [Pseudogymnoascus sp. VKM F-3775]